MLERTSACLDNGVRLSLRAQRLLPKTRRLLHSTFWTPQAPDLHDPPPSHHPPAVLAASSAPSAPSSSPSEPHDTPFLDFLYPLPTQAFIARLSQSDKWSRRNTRLPVLRGYSSLTTPQDTSPEPHQELRNLLTLDTTTTPPSTFDVERAWKLCSDAHLDVPLRKQAISWFFGLQGDANARHVLDLFACLPHKDRSASDYRAAVGANCRLDHNTEAIALHTEASGLPFSGSIGSEFLIPRAIDEKDWSLASAILHVFDTYVAKSAEALHHFNPWIKVKSSLAPNLESLVAHIQSIKEADKTHALHRLYGSMLQGYAATLSRHGTLMSPKHAASIERRRLKSFIQHLHDDEFGSTENFEKVLLTLLRVPKGATNSGCSDLVVFTYMLYHRSLQFSPSAHLLEQMLDYWREHTLAHAGHRPNHSYIELEVLVEQWQRFHGKVGDDALMTIMETFAKLGNVEAVKSYASTYKSLHPEGLPDSSKLWPLIYVHAVLAKPNDAADQIYRFKQDYGVEPNARCWNILLHAYDRAGDLSGAAAMFNTMIETGQYPDAYAYGSLLNLYAKRGDIDSVVHLLGLASSTGMTKPTTHMLNSMILALVNNDDIEGARRALHRTIKATLDGEVKGSLTLCFNTMFVAYALRRDLNATMEVYRRMREEKIELDERSFGALMQVLCLFRQTPSAHKILNTVMPLNKIRPMAFHYAILMSGYVNQGMYEDALSVARQMDVAKVRATTASRAIALKAKAYHEHAKKRDQVDEDGNPAFLEEVMDDYKRLLDNPNISPPINQPMPGYRHESPGSRVIDAGFMIYIHGARRSFAAVDKLFQMYQNKLTDVNESASMLRLLTTLMSVHCQAKEYAEVDRYWHLIKKHVDQLRLNHFPATDLKERGKSTSATASPLANKRKKIVPSHRFMLSRPLRYYVISQFAQSTSNNAISTIVGLLSSGFELDNRTWNTYIHHLCEAGPPRALLAFTLVEKFMIADWPGWITARRGIITNETIRPKRSARKEGLEYIKTRYLRPGQLLPQYRTMVRLARALLEVRNFEASGMSYEMPKTRREYRELMKQVGSVAEIREKAPRTLHAVQRMPRVLDDMQANLFGGFG